MAGAPGNVNVARVSDSTQQVTWTNPSFPQNYKAIQVARVDSRTPSSWTTVYDTTGYQWNNPQSYNDNGTTANRRYRYRVRGQFNVDSTWSEWAYTDWIQTTPAAPSGAQASRNGTNGATVQWINGGGNLPLDYAYQTEVWRRANSGTWQQIATVTSGTTSYGVTGLSGNTTYEFLARHVSLASDATTANSNTTSPLYIENPPAAPTGFSVSRTSDTSHTASWTNPSNPSSAPYTSITVQRWDNVSNAWSTIANLSSNAASVVDTGTVANRKYRYQVRTNGPGGSSAWVQSSYLYTTPSAPSNASAAYNGGTSIGVSWTNNASYTEYTTEVTPYKNGVAETPVSVASGNTSYTLTGADIAATYYFVLKTVAGSLSSSTVQSNSVTAATAPNAPTGLNPQGGVIDLALAQDLTWTHSPSNDGSAQTKFEVEHRLSGAGTWTSTGAITSTTSSWTLPANTYSNGQTVEWRVRTWGVHPDPSPFSSTASVTGSTTPTVTLNTPGATLPTSVIEVDWSYFDAESTAQAEWEVSLYTATGSVLIEEKSGLGTTSNVVLDTAAINGDSYELHLRVRDSSGLWSNTLTHAFVGDFTPPAEVEVEPSYDPDTGVVVLTLTPTADDGGVTTLPATAATVERQIYDPETGEYGAWETVIANVSPSATVIDTTAPINDDGHYRVVTYSGAPSSTVSITPVRPVVYESKWVYVSGGENFSVVCRMWANVELTWKSSRTKAMHYFAGRSKPVLYSGEHSEKVLSVTGLIADDASPPHQWLRLGKQPGPVLLRAPGNRRIYGSLSEVNVERIQSGLHRVSFSIQEIAT